MCDHRCGTRSFAANTSHLPGTLQSARSLHSLLPFVVCHLFPSSTPFALRDLSWETANSSASELVPDWRDWMGEARIRGDYVKPSGHLDPVLCDTCGRTTHCASG